MNIGFVSLGCSKNLVDSEKVMGLLKNSGHTITNNPAEADAIFINTCGFINPAKEEGINTILEMAEYKQDKCKKLIVLGCLAQRYKTELEKELPEVDRFIGVQEYNHLEEILQEELGTPILGTYGKMERLLSTRPYTAYLKIAEGCSNRCAYCAIPLIRGNQVSYDMDELVSEAIGLAKQGVQELVVIAQDTTRYGNDWEDKQLQLPKLLSRLNAISGFKWIRILYMYPDSITNELLQTMKECPKVLPYFDIPIQHADDTMLKLMNRHGNSSDIMDTIERIRSVFPEAILRTTMIVGFPGETDEQFERMITMTKEVKFDRLGAFTYSLEEDTPAFSMDHQIDEEIKEDRLRRLMTLQESIAETNGQKLVGQVLEVLSEKRDPLTYTYHGRSIYSAPDNVDGEVLFTSDRLIRSGEFVRVLITESTGHDLVGTEIKKGSK